MQRTGYTVITVLYIAYLLLWSLHCTSEGSNVYYTSYVTTAIPDRAFPHELPARPMCRLELDTTKIQPVVQDSKCKPILLATGSILLHCVPSRVSSPVADYWQLLTHGCTVTEPKQSELCTVWACMGSVSKTLSVLFVCVRERSTPAIHCPPLLDRHVLFDGHYSQNVTSPKTIVGPTS